MLKTKKLSPLPLWLQDPELQTLFKILNARLVGGSVRETLLGHPMDDFDLATPFQPEDVIQILKKNNFKAIPTGLKHGTITALGKTHPYEITTLRRDIETFGRHAKISYTDSWEEDALRRDFTFNALYCDADGLIYDYTNGLFDLETKTLRFIGDPYKRINEDYLRILRYFRFLSQYHGPIDSLSYESCCNLSAHLNNLSGERIAKEFWKLLSNPHDLETLKLMSEGGVLKFILPQPYMIQHLEILKQLRIETSPDFKFFMLAFPKTNSAIHLLKKKLKLSNKFTKYLSILGLENLPIENEFTSQFYHFLYKNGPTLANDWLTQLLVLKKISLDCFHSFQAFLNIWKKESFPIRASDLKKRGLEDGPDLGKALQIMLNAWIESGFILSKEECLKIIT